MNIAANLLAKSTLAIMAVGALSACSGEQMLSSLEDSGNELRAVYFSQALPNTDAQLRYRLVGNGQGGSRLCGFTDAATFNDRTLAAGALLNGELTLQGQTYDVDMLPLSASSERCVDTLVAWNYDLPMHEMDLGVSDAGVFAYVQ